MDRINLQEFQRGLGVFQPVERHLRDYARSLLPRIPTVTEAMASFADRPDLPNLPPHLVPVVFRDDHVAIADPLDVTAVRQYRYLPAFFHNHNHIEILYVLEGACHLNTGTGLITLGSGDLCLSSPSTRHSHVVDDDHSVVIILGIRCHTFADSFFDLLLSQDFLSDFFLRALHDQDKPYSLLFRTGDDREVANLFLEMLWEVLHQQEYRQAMLNNLFNRLVLCLGRHHRPSRKALYPEDQASNQVLIPLLRYLRGRFRDATLAGLAEKFGYSPSHTSHLIKSQTGKNFTQLVREIRVHQATVLLRDPDLPMAEIADQLGYADTSHFYKDFRKVHRLAPGEFRRQSRMTPK